MTNKFLLLLIFVVAVWTRDEPLRNHVVSVAKSGVMPLVGRVPIHKLSNNAYVAIAGVKGCKFDRSNDLWTQWFEAVTYVLFWPRRVR